MALTGNCSNLPWRGIFSMIGGFLIHLTFGTIYCFGNFSPYFVSYLRSRGSNITYETIMWTNTVGVAGQGSFILVSGLFAPYIAPKVLIAVACCIMSAGVALAGLAIKHSAVLFILTYGAMFGAGVGLGYAITMYLAMGWFPKYKGLVNGIIVGGFGLGALVFNQVGTAFVNPNNEKVNDDGVFTQKDILERIPNLLFILGGCYFAVQAIGFFLLSVPKEREQVEGDNAEEKPKAQDLQLFPDDTPVLEIIKSPLFILLWINFVCCISTITFISPSYKTYGQRFIKDDNFMAMVGSVASIFNSVGRIAWGFIQDKTSYWLTATTASGGLVILYGTLVLDCFESKAAFAFWIWAIFLLFSSNFVLCATCMAKIFGVKNIARNYGMVFIGAGIGGALQNGLSQVLVEDIGYGGIGYILAGFSFIACICAIAFKFAYEKKRSSDGATNE